MNYRPPRTARAAIRDFCAQCMGWVPGERAGKATAIREARECGAIGCPLWILRARFFKADRSDGEA